MARALRTTNRAGSSNIVNKFGSDFSSHDFGCVRFIGRWTILSILSHREDRLYLSTFILGVIGLHNFMQSINLIFH